MYIDGMPLTLIILVAGITLSASPPGTAETLLTRPAGASEERVSVTDIRYSESSSSLRVEVEMSAPPTFTRGEVGDPPRVYVDVENARVGAGLHNRIVPVGSTALARIRVAQHDRDTVRVVLDLTPTSAVSTFRVLETPWRLVVDVVDLGERAKRSLNRGSATKPEASVPDASTESLEIRSVSGRVSIRGENVPLGDLLGELDSVAATDSTIAPNLESYRVDVWVDRLPVDQAIGKLFEGRPVDYAVIGRRRIVVLGISEDRATRSPAVPAHVDDPICRLPQGGRYAVGATPAFEDAYYLCASVLTQDDLPPRAVWVLMESSDAGLSFPTPTNPGTPCTLPGALSYMVGAIVLQDGVTYRCAHVLDDNLDPAGTAWVAIDDSGS